MKEIKPIVMPIKHMKMCERSNLLIGNSSYKAIIPNRKNENGEAIIITVMV